jgi:glycosyltransferase involved in cell wall biosynthesis
MVNNRISILLSTFNSGFFLKDQIDSIVLQSNNDWVLFIRDDGSSDDTVSIIEEYCRHFDNIVFLKDDLLNLGSKNSFIRLLSEVDAQYYMFCDHDDVWLPFKVEKTIRKMIEIEKQYPLKPALVFTDLKVVDDKLNIINNSMWNYQRTNPLHAKDVYYLSVSNPVTGCTVMINQMAKEISLPMPRQSLMHDLWIALNVSYYGCIDFVDEPTLLYRQHKKNVLGARNINRKYYISRLKSITKVISDNIKLIRMINSLNFRISHFRRVRIKIKILRKKILF